MGKSRHKKAEDNSVTMQAAQGEDKSLKRPMQEVSVQAERNADICRDRDERAMIREQERQARERRRKKSRRRRRIAGGVILAAAVVCGWYIGWGRGMLVSQEETVAIVAGSGQQIIYGELVRVNGNEITYTVAEEAADETASGQEDSEISADLNQENIEQPEAGEAFGEGEQPEAGEAFGEGERPGDGKQLQGREQSDGGDFEGMHGKEEMSGEMPQTEENQVQGGFEAPMAAETFTYNGNTYLLTEETVTAQIPVGTDVTTRLGTVTTFSRLAAGDCIALVVEEEDGQQIIMAVYIIG